MSVCAWTACLLTRTAPNRAATVREGMCPELKRPLQNQVMARLYHSYSTSLSLNYSFEWHNGLKRVAGYANPEPAQPTLPTKQSPMERISIYKRLTSFRRGPGKDSRKW